MANINLKIEDDIAVIEFDQPHSKVNVLNQEAMLELDSALEKIVREPQLKALLIASKKDGIFIAGADIKEIEYITSYEDAILKADKGKEILNKLYSLNLITVAAINGACLGGGFELALACKYRVASFSDKVKIGLPEVKLGLIPGFGGTQLLPRLIGLIPSIGMIVSGEIVSGKDALRRGIVDRLFPDKRLSEEAIAFIRGIIGNKTYVNRKRKTGIITKFLEGTFLGRAIVFSQARKAALRKTKGFYPAPLMAIEVLKRTYGRNLKEGFKEESRIFSKLAVTEVSKNLIKVFYLNEEYKKFQWVEPEVKANAVKKCAVVGAGVMGAGIAQLLSFYDIPVRLKDIDYEALKRGLKTIKGVYDYAVKKRILRNNQADYKIGLVAPTINYSGFENADLIIEAAVEDLALKQKLFGEFSRIAKPDAIFASNTSSLPIAKIAHATHSPERVVGLHFFNPVHRMPLIEIIKSDKTSPQTLANAVAFARRLGKVVIVASDVPGFLINRILLCYLNEAGNLLEEGVKISRLDALALAFGMPMGPFELIDEVGIDVGYKVAHILEDSYGERMKAAPILERLKDKGLFGKKTKKGFYIYKGAKKIPNEGIYGLVGKISRRAIPDGVLLKRLIYVMINEAGRCLEERVVGAAGTIDIGMIMGTGFPPFRAGLLRYADSVGVGNIVNDLREFEKEFKSGRFKPCDYILKLAQANSKFYGG